VKAFHGDYEITVRHGGAEKRVESTLAKGGDTSAIVPLP
jgi:hypothetical protein